MKPALCAKLAAVLAAPLILGMGTACADHRLDLRLDLGYDTNVFDLNESIGEQAGRFSQLGAGFSAEDRSQGGWKTGIDAGAAVRRYESSVSDGDEGRYFGRVYGDSGGTHGDHVFEWALRYRQRDSTYVSRFTGMVATEGGTEIGDRHDSTSGDLRAAWLLPGGDLGRLSLAGYALNRNYLKDYASLGLERLDYEEFGLEPEYRIGSRDFRFRLGLIAARRQYRDRRLDDANGDPVAGTNLEYTLYGIETRYQHELTRAHELEFAGGYDLRTDNGVGFDDRTRWNVGVSWAYRPEPANRLSVELEWSSREFDRPRTGDPTVVDETPEKKGYRLGVRYVRPFPGTTTPGISLHAEIGWESFDNTDEVRFSYDRLVGFAGIRREF